MKIKELYDYAIKLLKKHNIEDANLKSRILLCYVLGKDKNYINVNYNQEVDKEIENKFIVYINEIINGKPLQYITNEQEFMGLKFFINENVLIPQPDTEILVEEVLNKLKEKKGEIDILDLCTGSGIIAISLAKYGGENLNVYATDISKDAIDVAKKNAKLNNVKVDFIVSDMFENIPNKKFDIIVSNPPYIEEEVIYKLSKEVQNEPYIALNGGKDGLYFYKKISKTADMFLKEDGEIFLEIGYNQRKSVTLLFKNNKVTCIKDLAGNDRVLKIEKKGK